LHGDKKTVRENILTIGMVGYPNVGKSSTINSLLQYKKVSVSTTPGKTKHFQTIFLDKNLLLCDCPGLVFPSFVSTKDELIINGILPIDQMRDYVGPVNLVCHQVPRTILSDLYHIMLPLPNEGEYEHRPPTSIELCSTYAYARGFMTHKGIPDCSRAARLILKNYVQGKLLYCYPPPGEDSNKFQQQNTLLVEEKEDDITTSGNSEAISEQPPPKFRPSTLDEQFFRPIESRVGTKGVFGKVNYTRKDDGVPSTTITSSSTVDDPKPWKKHHHRNKHEKLRRIYKHLDA